MKLNKIELCFENCETASVKEKDIAVISASGITDGLHWNSTWKNCYTTKQCEQLYIQLRPEADIEMEQMFNGETLFKRISNFNDIVSVVFYFEDNPNQEIYVKWNSKDSDNNKYQTSVILNNRNLLIVCSQEYTAEEFKKKYEKPMKVYGE